MNLKSLQKYKIRLINVVNTGLQGRWQQLRAFPKLFMTRHTIVIEIVLKQIQKRRFDTFMLFWEL
jgi:dihydrofolate synthase/folylpolyglutamate synthase